MQLREQGTSDEPQALPHLPRNEGSLQTIVFQGRSGFARDELNSRQDVELAEDRKFTALRLACIKDAHLVKLSDFRRT
ncbi:hypothetical protein DIPPA_21713 [Diplonema papillatum]|nr:hypothetical protein DIPPA_21713 [Diplonema papillatum]